MTATMMTPAQLARFEARLLAERADAEERLAEFDDAMAEVRIARSDATADDEHDPEGPTMTQEWSQRTAVLADVRAELAEVDRALARIADGELRHLRAVRQAHHRRPPRRAPHRDALHRLRAPRGLSRRIRASWAGSPRRRVRAPRHAPVVVSASGPDASSAGSGSSSAIPCERAAVSPENARMNSGLPPSTR